MSSLDNKAKKAALRILAGHTVDNITDIGSLARLKTKEKQVMKKATKKPINK